MKADKTELRRLGEGDDPLASLEARAGTFLGDARPTTGLRESEINAIERRLLGSRPARPHRLVPVWVALTVLLVTGTVAAVAGGWRPHLPSIGGSAEKPAAPLPKRTKTRPKIELAPVPSNLPTPESLPPAAPPSQPTLRLVPAPRRTARAENPSTTEEAKEVTATEGALSVEARSLADALARWRRERNAPAALALLDEHARRFPHGALWIESRVARAEILLGLSRKEQALAVLDSLSLANLPRARELKTLRGELRAQAGRCPEARADLQDVISPAKDDELGRRAASALGTCP